MDKRRIFFRPLRTSVSLLDSATFSSMLRRDSEIQCLREKLDGASDDDNRVLLSRTMFMIFLIVPSCTNSQTTLPGVSYHKEIVWKGKNCNDFLGIFREGGKARIFSKWFVRSLDYELRSMNLQLNERPI
jgi:hypothetical protein